MDNGNSFIQRLPEEELKKVVEQQTQEIAIKQLEYEAERRKKETQSSFVHECNGDRNMFLILLIYSEDESRYWEICDDRQSAYDFIKDNIKEIDVDGSRVISETVSFADDISVADFMLHVLETGKIEDPGYDPIAEGDIPADYATELDEEN